MARTKFWRVVIILHFLVLSGCDRDEAVSVRHSSLPPLYTLSSDKAVYNPGEEVHIKITPAVDGAVHVRYKFLGETISETTASGASFSWTPPTEDFKGYMIELFEPEEQGKSEDILATIGIDVSSDWTKFPRYGFLSHFPEMSEKEIEAVIENLTRHRINGIQFYDWHYKHHQPLAGAPENPTPVYRDIINREIHFNTVKQYIDAAHKSNIRAMFYNLVYGALKDAPAKGVQEDWYVYTSAARTEKDRHRLSPPFISDIYITDPSNPEWQQYLIEENRNVYKALAFDGFHMDQLGDRGARYNYNGALINLAEAFEPFIEAIDADDPSKANVMNAVNQYGQHHIVQAPVDFLYTEVWSPNDTYYDLANIILQNNSLSEGKLNTVLAAYVNYDIANQPGYFNSPSVLMADAVIFAFGGTHLELGEHMLAKEYFPNDNLAMRDDLKRTLINFYDFLVAYQNLLRDGGSFNSPSLISADSKVRFSSWPPEPGRVAVVGKQVGNRQVLHLLNFMNAATMQWRDNNGVQAVPVAVENLQVRFTPPRAVSRAWCAAPDFSKGASIQLELTRIGNQVSFTIPGLQYWTMVVLEYQ